MPQTIIDKLRKIEELIARGSTPGERNAAQRAYARLKIHYSNPAPFSEWMACPNCGNGWHRTYIVLNATWVKCCRCEKVR